MVSGVDENGIWPGVHLSIWKYNIKVSGVDENGIWPGVHLSI